jgi:hypothetical protein
MHDCTRGRRRKAHPLRSSQFVAKCRDRAFGDWSMEPEEICKSREDRSGGLEPRCGRATSEVLRLAASLITRGASRRHVVDSHANGSAPD